MLPQKVYTHQQSASSPKGAGTRPEVFNNSNTPLAVLCCAVLCCAVLCCAVLCCNMLCCAMTCCKVVGCTALCYCQSVLYCHSTVPSMLKSHSVDGVFEAAEHILFCHRQRHEPSKGRVGYWKEGLGTWQETGGGGWWGVLCWRRGGIDSCILRELSCISRGAMAWYHRAVLQCQH